MRRLAGAALPAGVKVADFNIRGLHLAYELLDGGYETAILVDATRRGREPGTVYVIEPDQADSGADLRPSTPADGHGMARRPSCAGSLRRVAGWGAWSSSAARWSASRKRWA